MYKGWFERGLVELLRYKEAMFQWGKVLSATRRIVKCGSYRIVWTKAGGRTRMGIGLRY
jgi:hypothetical protein